MDYSSPSLLFSAPQRRFLFVGGIYIVLWISTWYSAQLLENMGGVSLWFLPAGLRFFCLLVFGWPGVVLELTVQFVFALMQITAVAGAPITEFLSANTLWRLFNLLGSLVANAVVVIPLRRRIRDDLDFTRPSHNIGFLAAAMSASTLSALAGTYGIVQLGFIKQAQFAEVFPSWLIGDFIGIITLTPLLLVRFWPGLKHYLHQGQWHFSSKPKTKSGNADIHTILIVALALLAIFGMPWYLGMNPHFPLLALLLLFPLVGIAWHYGLRGAVLAVIILDSGLVMLISLFGQRDQALQYQVVMIAIALVGLWLGGAVEALNRLMVRYRDFASVSNDLLWETDRKGYLIEASGRLAEYISWSPGRSWRSLLVNDSQPHIAQLEHAVAQRHPFRNLEVALQGAKEVSLWVQLNGLPLLNDLGEFIGYRGTAIDVSRSRRAEELQHRYNENLLKEVAERTRDLDQSNRELSNKERHL